MRVLVTGVAGFIGSCTAKLLLQHGYEVVGIDNLSSGTEENIPAGVEFVLGDIADRSRYRSMGEIDGCIHFAGRIEAGESMRAPARFFVENIAKTQILLEIILDKGCNSFVFSSSAAVYGAGTFETLSEGDPKSPSSPYGYSKLVVEETLSWLHELRGLRYAALRYFNAAGASDNVAENHQPETHLIPLLINSLDPGGRSFTVFGSDYLTFDGTCIRDYVHVSDLARAHVLALEYLSKNEKIIVNLGSGEGNSVLEVINSIEEVTARKVNFDFGDRRQGDPPYLVANVDLAKSLLKWEPTNSKLIQIIADAWSARCQARGMG